MDRTFTQSIDGDYKDEIRDAFETVGIMVRAKIERLGNNGEYDEAERLEKALKIINNTDYNR